MKLHSTKTVVKDRTQKIIIYESSFFFCIYLVRNLSYAHKTTLWTITFDYVSILLRSVPLMMTAGISQTCAIKVNLDGGSFQNRFSIISNYNYNPDGVARMRASTLQQPQSKMTLKFVE